MHSSGFPETLREKKKARAASIKLANASTEKRAPAGFSEKRALAGSSEKRASFSSIKAAAGTGSLPRYELSPRRKNQLLLFFPGT